MAMLCFSTTLATPGTPQSVGASDSPARPGVNMGGTAFPAGSVTERGYQILLQAAPTNTAGKTIYVGTKGMVVSTKAGVGFALAIGNAPVSIGQFGGALDIADLYWDSDSVAAATEKLLVTVIG